MKSNNKNFSIRGIDISKWQGNVDMKKVKKSVDFVMIRSSYGRTMIDPYFHENMRKCELAGIPYGIYHYVTSISLKDAKDELDFFVENIRGSYPTYPIVIDIEDTWHRNNSEMANAIALLMIRKLESMGYFAMLYTNKDFYDNVWNSSVKKDIAIWYARYTDVPFDVPANTHMIQYTSKGRVDGISGNVDLNTCRTDFDYLIKSKCLNRLDIDETEKETCTCGCNCCGG